MKRNRQTKNEIEVKDKLYCRILLSLRKFNQRNPSTEDFTYILNTIEHTSQSLYWRSFPKDLWPTVLSHLSSLQDLHHSLLVCQSWKDILLSEDFWETYASFNWHLDTTIKSAYTVPASKYAKLRLYLNTYSNGSLIAACNKQSWTKQRDQITDIASYELLFSRNQLGLISVYWNYADHVDSEGEGPGSSYSCRVTCNDYSCEWFGGSCTDLMVFEEVVEKDGKDWVEGKRFKEIRRMMGYKDWKELLFKVVYVCVDEEEESVWNSEYRWEDFAEYYDNFVQNCDYTKKAKGLSYVKRKVSFLEKLTGLKLQ
eukprot:TRINITY_DN9966_c0_g2_i1.p1 TRINITY_DN9966_c0_g2~~TRINITY_DN9966_c0_g2_i1.p1  ORF type:complete len:312 (+),score=73.24 TRINITY_DN9966_c0_g2_i1:28-963(+)